MLRSCSVNGLGVFEEWKRGQVRGKELVGGGMWERHSDHVGSYSSWL